MTREEAIKKLEETVGAYLLSGRADDTTCGEWREILETLKQEPCEDCISRQAVLDAFADYVGSGMSMNDFDALWDIVVKIQPVDMQKPKFIAHSDGTIEQITTRERGEWIPVSEGLPKCNGAYEVTIQTDEGRYTSACYFDGSDTWYNDNRINHMRAYVTDKVIAWMPRPEPYKSEVSE